MSVHADDRQYPAAVWTAPATASYNITYRMYGVDSVGDSGASVLYINGVEVNRRAMGGYEADNPLPSHRSQSRVPPW